MRLLDIVSIIGYAGFIQCSRRELENEGYTVNDELGKAYKIMYYARPWNEARLACFDDGGKLAVPKTEQEFKFLQQMARKMKYGNLTGTDYGLLLWLGINNKDNYKVWVDVNGQNIKDSGFHTWAGNNGDSESNSPFEPHCAGVDGMNFGLRDFWCHRPLPYICEKLYNY